MKYTDSDNEMFEKFWILNSIGKKNEVLANFQSAMYHHKKTAEELYNSYKEYMDMCKVQKRDAQFIMQPINYLSKEEFLAEHHAAGANTLNFIDRWLEDL